MELHLILLAFAFRLVDCVTITPVAVQVAYSNGAHWDLNQNLLFYTDQALGYVYRFDPTTNTSTNVFVGPQTSNVLVVRGTTDQFLVTSNLSVLLVEWDGHSPNATSITELFTTNDATKNRYDRMKADINGVLFAGTIANFTMAFYEALEGPLAHVYRYRNVTPAYDYCSVDVILSGTYANDGLDWSPDNTLMYFVNTQLRIVNVFDYDVETAEISNGRVFFNLTANGLMDTPTHSVVPEDLVIDCTGTVWLAIYGLGMILEISPDGVLLSNVTIPTSLPTSVVWGGPDLSTLYVTTLSLKLRPSEIPMQPLAGAVFAIDGLGRQGFNGGGYPPVICKSNSCS